MYLNAMGVKVSVAGVLISNLCGKGRSRWVVVGGLCVWENRRVRRGRARQVGLAGTAALRSFMVA